MRERALKSFSATFREGVHSASSKAGGRTFKGVTIIKAGLGNAADRHFYPANVLKEAVDAGQFNRLRAYADHPSKVDEVSQPERTIRDLVGLYDNVRFVREGERGGRVVGDLKILRSHKWLADTVDDLVAMNAADKIGISINGSGETAAKVMEAGGEKVNQVLNFRKLDSADIVTEAGAGGGFYTLREAARAARQERTSMAKTSKVTKQELLAQIAEAATKGDGAKVTELSQQLEAAVDGAKASKADKPKKVAEAKSKKSCADDETKEAAKDEDADEDADEADDVDLEEADADADADDDADEGDESDDEDSDDDADDDVDDAADVRESRRDGASLRDRFAAGTRTREAGAKGLNGMASAPKNPAAKGGAKKGTGSFTKKAGTAMGVKGRRYAEADADPAAEMQEMRETIDTLTRENRKLLKNETKRQLEAKAGAIVKAKVPGLDTAGQRALASKLVRECNTPEEMEREAVFYSRLMEGAVGRVKEQFEDADDEGVDGFPSRMRESYGANGADASEAILAEVGIPLKQAKA